MEGSGSNAHHKMILEVGKIQQTVELMLNGDLSPNAAYRNLDKLFHGIKEQVGGYVNASNAQRAYNHDPRQYHQLASHMNPPPGPPPQGHPHMPPQQHQPMMLGPGYHLPQHPPPPPPGMFGVAEIPHQYSPAIEYGPSGPDQRPPLTEKPIPQQTNQIVESTSQSVSGKEETALAIVRKIKQGSSKKKNVKRIKMDVEKLNKEQILPNHPHQCMLCNKRFATYTQNKRHQLTHIKPFSCTICAHRSAEKVKIRQHCWKTHGNRDLFEYTVPERSPDPEGEGQVERNENEEDSCDSYDLDITSNGDEDSHIDDSMDPLGGISPGKSSRGRGDEDDKDTDEKPFMYFGRPPMGTENYEDLS